MTHCYPLLRVAEQQYPSPASLPVGGTYCFARPCAKGPDQVEAVLRHCFPPHATRPFPGRRPLRCASPYLPSTSIVRTPLTPPGVSVPLGPLFPRRKWLPRNDLAYSCTLFRDFAFSGATIPRPTPRSLVVTAFMRSSAKSSFTTTALRYLYTHPLPYRAAAAESTSHFAPPARTP